MYEQAVRAEIESIRFSLIERHELMRTQYFLRFRRKIAGLTFSGGEYWSPMKYLELRLVDFHVRLSETVTLDCLISPS